MTTLKQLNAMSSADFTSTLADIFEHSPWVAAGATAKRPYDSVASLHRAMVAVMAQANKREQLKLLRAHPSLAGKAARLGTLSAASTGEQAGAGLDRLTPDEYEQFHRINNHYEQHFGFPFILAVKGHDKDSILKVFAARAENDAPTELQTALAQVAKIARFRLEALVETESEAHGPL